MNFLNTIIEHKKREVAAAKMWLPLERLRPMALRDRKRRPFKQKLRRPGINIIAEIKRTSPSKGTIRSDLDPARYAAAYEQGGAAALSVLTDQAFFRGSIEDLQAARRASALPVLRKDFTIDPYQIYESAAMGADAVLLIVRILSKEQLTQYLTLSRELGLDTLVEINSEEDLEAAAEAGAELIGINNRNLQSFDTDVGTAARLSRLLEPHQIPVAASGIRTREDIENTLQAGIHNFLIGESLVRAEDPVQFLQTLLGR